MPSRGDRIDVIVEALAAIAPDRFDLEEIETRAGSGDRCVCLRPHKDGAPPLLATDTGVSWYLEVPQSKWEADSSDAAGSDQSAQRQWAVEKVQSIAKFGVVRIHRRWLPFGRESIILGSSAELANLRTDRSIRVISPPQPWI